MHTVLVPGWIRHRPCTSVHPETFCMLIFYRFWETVCMAILQYWRRKFALLSCIRRFFFFRHEPVIFYSNSHDTSSIPKCKNCDIARKDYCYIYCLTFQILCWQGVRRCLDWHQTLKVKNPTSQTAWMSWLKILEPCYLVFLCLPTLFINIQTMNLKIHCHTT